MTLIDELERLAASEESLFRRQLLREDIARIRRLQALAQSALDLDAFRKAGLRLGWTQGDARTEEIRAPLERFLDSVYEMAKGAGADPSVTQAWNELHRVRMERLLGCLATPVPRPAE